MNDHVNVLHHHIGRKDVQCTNGANIQPDQINMDLSYPVKYYANNRYCAVLYTGQKTF